MLLLPILLYYCVFLAVEPNNYFSLRATTPSGASIGTLQDFERHPTDHVILGDSRFAHLDMGLIKRLTGEEFSNLSFGGASVKETLDRLDWVLERRPDLQEVVLGLSFYTLNAAYKVDRTESILQAMNNPIAYLTSLSFNIEVVQNALFVLQGETLFGGEAETRDPATYEFVEYENPLTGKTVPLRRDIVDYLGDIGPNLDQWALNQEQLDRLLEAIERCTEQGIRITVVLPPLHPAVREQQIVPLGIDVRMQPALDALHASSALFLDYEFENPPDFAEDQYFDGLHVDYKRGLPVFTRMLFGDMNPVQCMLSTAQ